MGHGWRLAWLGWPVVVCACGPTVGVETGGGAGSSEDSTTGGADSVGPSTGATASTTVATSDPTQGASEGITPPDETTTEWMDESTGVAEGGTFLVIPDGGGYPCSTFSVCDVWAQDCPEGEKCVITDGDGTADLEGCVFPSCVPLDPNPVPTGSPCTMPDGPWSGVDDCDIGAFCWDVDPVTLEGTCVASCMGSEANPLCDGGLTCVIDFASWITVCVPGCDPLAPACGEGGTCGVTNGAPPVCLPTSLGVPATQAAACNHTIGCGDGFACMAANTVAGCEDPSSCCTAICDPAAPVCDASVPVCTALVGVENIGACTV